MQELLISQPRLTIKYINQMLRSSLSEVKSLILHI